MKNLSIRTQVLLVALLPLLVIALLLTGHFTTHRVRELDRALNEHGQAIARQLAPACEYGVFAGNREILARLGEAALRETDVVGVTVTDDLGAVLAQVVRGDQPMMATAAAAASLMLTFRAPIERSEVPVEDFQDAEMAIDDVNHLKLFGQTEQGRHRAMAVTLDLLKDAIGQTFQQVFRPSQIGQNNRSGFSIDPSGLHDAPVEMSPGSSFLKGGHIGVYNTQYGGRCQELFYL